LLLDLLLLDFVSEVLLYFIKQNGIEEKKKKEKKKTFSF